MDAGDAELRQRIVAALTALTKVVEDQGKPDFLASAHAGARRLTYSMFGATTSSVLHDNLARPLRITTEFRSLHEYFMGNPALLEVLLGIDPVKANLDSQHILAFSTYVEATLIRVVLLIRYRDDSEPEGKLVDKFVSFMTPGSVHRKVSVPINHLATKEPELDLGGCGRLVSTRPHLNEDDPHREILELADVPTCKLIFEIATGKFVSAWNTEISNYLRLRIALIRLVVQPLASFNHFSVNHIGPWEEPLLDTNFVERFWGRSGRGRKEVPVVCMSQDHARQVSTLFDHCDGLDWNSDSPWRLAINRLDDAVFKLESGSPDSLLDVVIGLESVMVEAESTQESTHKVASRTARFLNDDLDGRRATFKEIKHLYSLRSKIAHGKAIALNENRVTALADGATTLCRVLKKMLEQRQVRLDHQILDLG